MGYFNFFFEMSDDWKSFSVDAKEGSELRALEELTKACVDLGKEAETAIKACKSAEDKGDLKEMAKQRKLLKEKQSELEKKEKEVQEAGKKLNQKYASWREASDDK